MKLTKWILEMIANTIKTSLSQIHHKQPWLVMNAAKKFSLANSSHPVISHFYAFEAGDVKQTPFAIPDGCIDVLFDCHKEHPTAEVFGTPLEAVDINLTRNHRYFGIRYKPSVMPDFLNLAASELVNKHYSLLDLIPTSNQLVDEITREKNFVSQISAFETFMAKKQQRKHSDLTAFVVKQICLNQGNIKIKDLEASTGYTTRTLQRKFQDDMGVSPKVYSRIIRCQSAVYKINQSDNVSFSDLAFDLGFTDQPHFLREFKRLVSTTPLRYQGKVKHQSYLNKIQYA